MAIIYSDYTQGRQRSAINTAGLETRSDRSSFLRNVRADLASLFQLHNITREILRNLHDDPVTNGLDGRYLYSDRSATSDSSALYWNSVGSEPNSVKESFDFVLSQLSDLGDTISLLGSPPQILSDLTDVAGTSPTTGQVLAWNGSAWAGANQSRVFSVDREMSAAANATVRFRGWAPVACELKAVTVRMQAVNTVGAYTLTVTRVSDSSSLLSAASYDMNTLSSATVTSLPLGSTLTFAANDEFLIELTSDNAGFTPTEATRIQLYFEVA